MEQLQRAGVPMLDSLADVRDTAESNATRDILTELHREVSEGANLSEAMGKHPNVFENIFVSLIAAGEETGNLMGSFSQVVRHLKWVDAMNAKKKKALRYPKILMFVKSNILNINDFADLATFELIDKEEGILKELDLDEEVASSMIMEARGFWSEEQNKD